MTFPKVENLVSLLPTWLQQLDPNIYKSDNYVVVDFETTIIEKGSPYVEENSIVMSSFRYGPDHPDYTPKTQVIIGNEYEQQRLVEAIEKADYLVAHNSKFEWGWLERCGLDLSQHLAFCTQIAEYVLMSNRLGAAALTKLSLDQCLLRRGFPQKEDLGKKLLKAGVCPSTWPRKWLLKYGVKDPEVGEKLFLDQRKALVSFGKLPTAFTRNIFTPVLVDMEKVGVHLDKERVLTLHRAASSKMLEIKRDIEAFTGGVNPSSPKQMREYLYGTLKFQTPPKAKKKLWGKDGESPTTSFEGYIGSVKPRTKKQARFQELQREYAKVNATLTKGLNKFADCVLETEDHILTASLNQTVTATQRLSSTGRNFRAQLQNIARALKPLFSARHKGWKVGEIDQGQLEYRVAVFLGQDEAGLNDIINKVDAHAFTATWLFGSAFEDASGQQRKDLRTAAKADTFKPLYGGQSGTTAQVRYYNAFKQKHEGITRAQNEWKGEVLSTGKLRIPSGLEFYFPGTKVTQDGYITNSTNICNYPVQSFATADIVPIGVTYQWHLIRIAGLQSFLVNTVHDSSVGEVHPDEEEIYSEIGEYAFVDMVYTYLKEVYDVDFNVPLEAEVEMNEFWADSEDWRKNNLTEAA